MPTTTTGSALIALGVLAWSIFISVAGIWLSWINNEKYNKKIVSLLEEIREGVSGTRIVNLEALESKKKAEKDNITEIRLPIPSFIANLGKKKEKPKDGEDTA